MTRLATLVLVLVSWLVSAVPVVASADANTVLQVTAVQVKAGQMDAYLAKVKQLQAIIKRLGASGTTRVWEATLAGDGTGTVVVGVEYPSLAAYAESTTKVSADAEWQKLMAGLDDLRTVVDRSLYRERTP